MKVYCVVSEELKSIGGEYVPAEVYRIAEIVRAKSAAQATYLAWQNDHDSRSRDMRDKPRFTVKLLGETAGEPGIISGREADSWWGVADGCEEIEADDSADTPPVEAEP